VERGSAEPQVGTGIYQLAREVGGSDWPIINDDEMANNKKLPPASRA
jgi:hypothetical protein